MPTDRPRLAFAPADAPALPLHVLRAEDAPGWLAAQPAPVQAWLAAQGWKGATGDPVVLPGPDGAVAGAVIGLGDAVARARGRFAVARAVARLPEGVWALHGDLAPEDRDEAALGWLLASYRFDRYRAAKAPGARLRAPAGCDAARLETIANAEALTRDLINTPASDMGPAELEAAFRALGARYGATVNATVGDDLLAQNFPMIHAVGRASPRAPRLLDLRWGDKGPKVTLVGKGVCFDTGGLDLKPSAGMLLMKKDMGGAATVMGLAQMIMESRPAGAVAAAGAGGGKRRVRQRHAPARHPDQPQGADGGNQQHRCRRPACAGRCAGAGL
jgi:leucyl aminopeptidase